MWRNKQSIAINAIVQVADYREDTFDGRPHLVVPVIAIVEGVLNNELLTTEHLAKTLPAWNGTPIPVGHPQKYGQHISANEREVLETDVIGTVFEPEIIDDNKFRVEFWIDVEKAENHKLGAEVIANIRAGKPMEVSTAYWRQLMDNSSGIYKGNIHDGVATNIVPDHIAILLDEDGACSVADGCGTSRANSREDNDVDIKTWWRRFADSIKPNSEDDSVKDSHITNSLSSCRLKAMSKHGLSFHDITRRLESELIDREGMNAFLWVEEVFDDRVVYNVETGDEFKTKSRPYTLGAEPDFVLDLGDATEVVRVVSFEPVSANSEQEVVMDRASLIEALVANQQVFNKETLEGFSDEQLEHLSATTNSEGTPSEGGEPAPATPPVEPQPQHTPTTPVEGADDGEDITSVQNSGLNPAVVDALNELGADGISAVLDAATGVQANVEKERKSLISQLKANENCRVPDSTLETMDVAQLQGVGATVNLTSYVGNGSVVGLMANESEEIPASQPILLKSGTDD